MLRLMKGIIKGPDEDSSRNQVRLGRACRQLGSTNGHFSAHCRGQGAKRDSGLEREGASWQSLNPKP